MMVFENSNRSIKFTIIGNTTLSGSTVVMSNMYYEYIKNEMKHHIDIMMPFCSLIPHNELDQLIQNFVQKKHDSVRVENFQEIYIVCVPEMGHVDNIIAKMKIHDDLCIFLPQNESEKPDFICSKIEQNDDYPLNIV